MSSERDRPRSPVRTTLYRLSARLLATYLVLRAVDVAGLIYVESLLRVDFFLFSTLFVGIPLLAYDVDRGTLPPRLERGIQYGFLVSLIGLAIAFSPTSSLPSVGILDRGWEFLRNNGSILLVISICTGILTVVSVRSNEIAGTPLLPELRRDVFGKSVSLRKSATVLCLAAILGYYVSLRMPFMADTFGGVIHGDKYATHVPILQTMHLTGEVFNFQNTAYTSIFNHESYVYRRYDKVPVFSWGPLPMMAFEPRLGIEFIVRSFTTVQGVALLVVLFGLVRELFDATIGLVGALLFAVNPLFNLVSYLTVMDLPALVLGFASVMLYWRDEKTYSYLLCGLAALTKYSFLLITAPTLALLIVLNETDKFYNATKLAYFTFVPILLFNTLIAPIPGETLPVGLIRLSVFFAVLVASALIFNRYEPSFVATVSKIDKRVRYSLMAVTPALGIVSLWNLISRFAPGFLTDRYLLFNVDVYATMLDLVRRQMSDLIYFLFPLGALWILLSGDERQRTTLVSLLFGVAFYAIVASKSVFIHTYYKHVLVFVGIIGFLGVFDAIRRVEISRPVVVPAAAAFTVLLVLSSQAASTALLDDDVRGTEAMGDYIDGNVAESELVLYTDPYGRLMAIYSDARLTYIPDGGTQAELEAEIQREGLGEALRNRDVRYYVSRGPIEVDDFEQLLTPGIQTNSRRNYILNEVDADDSTDRSPGGVSVPEGTFEREARFGEWYLYEIQAADQ